MRIVLGLLAILICAALPAAAQDPFANTKPKFELGAIGGIAYTPDYPASDQNNAHALVLPYLVYRGEHLYSDERGPAARLLNLRDLKFDISLSGSFPSHSSKNRAREGMPDLDYIGEIGPRLEWTMLRAVRDARIVVELPVRAAISTDLHSKPVYRGLVFAPEIAYQNDNFLESGTKLKLGLRSTFATSSLTDYFYQVDGPSVTPRRPAFDAHAGYLGTGIQFTALVPLGDRFKLIGYTKLDYLGGAENEKSPLFRENFNYAMGLGLVVSLFVSDARVQIDE